MRNLKNNNTKQQAKANKTVGYWAAQEQYSMQDLLKFVIEAERSGFNSTMTSDHFHPWWHDNGYSNFTWVWIAAAAEQTKRMKFVTGVTAPIYRYHPAIIAQSFASLDVLYPGRIGLGLGTGEAMNEVPLGYNWPKSSKVRLTRTIEAIQVMRNLWNEGRKCKQYGDGKNLKWGNSSISTKVGVLNCWHVYENPSFSVVCRNTELMYLNPCTQWGQWFVNQI